MSNSRPDYSAKLIGMSVLMALCFAFLPILSCAQDAMAQERAAGEKIDSGIGAPAEKVSFEIQLNKAHELRNTLLTKIDRIEKLQPDWNSSPLREALDQSIKGFESSTACYESLISVIRLSCQTPLLDQDLFVTATKLFGVIAKYYRDQNVLFVRTGQDSSGFLLDVERENQSLQRFLSDMQYFSSTNKNADSVKNAKVEQLNKMQDLLDLAAQEFRIGDTEKADGYYWRLLKLSEDTGNFVITGQVLKCYQCFLYGMYYRQNQELYRARRAYVFNELDCVNGDSEFASALISAAKSGNQSSIDELRAAHMEVIRLRRSGNNLATEKAYKKLVKISGQCGENATSLYYFALSAYHSFLEHWYSRNKHYDFLRRQLISAWIAEEISKQKSLSEANTQLGGDWSKLEDVFKKLEINSVFVGRDIALASRWGLSTNDAIFFTPLKYRNQRVVYYGKDSVTGDQLWLTCHTKLRSPTSPLSDLLVDTLREAGFKVTPSAHSDGTVVVYGEWSQKESKGLKSN